MIVSQQRYFCNWSGTFDFCVEEINTVGEGYKNSASAVQNGLSSRPKAYKTLLPDPNMMRGEFRVQIQIRSFRNIPEHSGTFWVLRKHSKPFREASRIVHIASRVSKPLTSYSKHRKEPNFVPSWSRTYRAIIVKQSKYIRWRAVWRQYRQ